MLRFKDENHHETKFSPWSRLSATFLLGCSRDGDQIKAYVQHRVEFLDDVIDTLELPALLTLSLGHKGKEEVAGSESAQYAVVLCRLRERFVFGDDLQLRTTCRRGDFYARASVREIQLRNPDACDEADTDGVLVLSRGEYFENAHIFAEDRTLAFDDRDCGLQKREAELSLRKLN